MFCKHCGKQLKEGQKFCALCGTAVLSHTSEQVEAATTPKLSKAKKVRRTIKIASVIVIIGIIISLKIVYSIENSTINRINSIQATYESNGNADQAIEQLKETFDDAILKSTKLSIKKNLGYIYSSEVQNDLALTTFKEALVFAPAESYDYYLISGEIALFEKKPEEALIAYNKAYELNPEEFQINNALNLFYLNTGDDMPQYENYPKALTYALKAHEVQKSELTKQNLAIAYFFNEDYKQTISLLLSTNLNSDPYISYWLGSAYIGDNQPEAAKRYLKIAQDKGVPIEPELLEYMKNN